MLNERILLKGAERIDFTGALKDFRAFPEFSDDVVSLLRGTDSRDTVVVVDIGYALEKPIPQLVVDHLNLTGYNPLVGPNNPIGERFPAVTCIYITDNKLLPQLPSAVAAGVKNRIVPSADEIELIKSLGADFYCYNLVPTMIVAAHAGWKVLGIVCPPGTDLSGTLANLFE